MKASPPPSRAPTTNGMSVEDLRLTGLGKLYKVKRVCFLYSHKMNAWNPRKLVPGDLVTVAGVSDQTKMPWNRVDLVATSGGSDFGYVTVDCAKEFFDFFELLENQ